MSAALPLDRPDLETRRRLPYLSWGGLVVLLVVEVMAMTLRFDGKTLGDQQGWVAGVIARSHVLISFGVCVSVVLASFLLGSVRDHEEGEGPTTPVGRGHRAWPFLLGHLGAYGCLLWLTGLIFEGPVLASNPVPWLSLWVAAGLATLSLWMLAALPSDRWARLARLQWRALLLAGLAGIAALALGGWTSELWGSFRGSTFWAVRGVLTLFYNDVICRPQKFILGTSRFQVGISPQCSGFEGIGLIWAFLGASLWWSRRELRFPQAFLLIPLGTALSWVFNVLRIAALIALGDRGWGALAVGGFHSQAGWLVFNGIALGLFVLSRRLPLFSRVAAARGEPTSTANPTAAYVVPLVVIALVTMVTGAFSEGGFDQLYAARVLAAVAVLWSFRHQYGALRAPCSWQAVAVGLAVYSIWTALEPAPPSGEAGGAVSAALGRMPRAWAWGWLAARSIGSVVIAPLAEELAFRGFLIRRLIAADFLAVPEGRFTWPSFLLSSLLFGLLHQQRWLAGTLAGMAYALVYYRRGRLIDAVAAHAMTNLLITISVFATGEWSKWS